jgi:putative transposase
MERLSGSIKKPISVNEHRKDGFRCAQPILQISVSEGGLSAAKPIESDRAMTSYRRNFVPGATYFFTVNLAERRLPLLTDNIAALRRAFRYTRSRHPFAIDAIVILPDHLHAIWTLPQGDADFAARWRLTKSAFSRSLPANELVTPSRSRKGRARHLAGRYWEHTLRDEQDYLRHIDYIHFNPVKHGHVEDAGKWPYSSFHRFVRLGLCPENWVAARRDEEAAFGERQ